MPGTDHHTSDTAAGHADSGYCADPGSADHGSAAHGGPAGGPPYADCVQCSKPTEYPADRPGIVLCPVCAWQEAQRSACSG